jgi:hypothetical protein
MSPRTRALEDVGRATLIAAPLCLLSLSCRPLSPPDAKPVDEAGRKNGAEKVHPPPASAAVLTVLESVAALGAVSGDGVPFSEVVAASTGQTVLTIGRDDVGAQRIIDVVAAAADSVLATMNASDSPVRGLRRINEASRHFERALQVAIDRTPQFRCTVPESTGGRTQRAGYPDLRVHDLATGRVAYLDPKLFEAGSERRSLRTFYYQPNPTTGKVTEDAHHLLIGFKHDGNDGSWEFLGWHLVDLSTVQVRLKAEFQAGNADLYQEAAVLRSGGP